MKFVKYLFIIFFSFIIYNLSAQSTLKHKKGAMAHYLGISKSYNTSGVLIGSRALLSPNYEYSIQLNYLTGTKGFTNFSTIKLENSIAYNFFSIGKNVYFLANGGFSLGYDKLYSSVDDNIADEDYFINFILGLKFYAYISKSVFLYGEFQQNLGYRKLGNAYTQYNFGIGFLIPNRKVKSVKKN